MRHYWLKYQIALSKIFFKTVCYPNSLKKNRPTTVWDIYFGRVEQTVCPNPTGGEQQKKESREDITFSH